MNGFQKNYSWPIIIAFLIAFAVASAVVLFIDGQNTLVKVLIPPGIRKEETAAILADALHWSPAQEQAFMLASTSADYAEGVYFPDTYLIPSKELPADVATRLINNFNEHFVPYSQDLLNQNIKWTVALRLASIIQREAASSSDMALISGILWNRLDAKMPLDVDSTVQYARGDTPTGWWAPIVIADLKIDSPYNTYLNTGLPPHPIDSPSLDAIDAALNPASTTCIYYLHDSSKMIHCSDTYAGQQANVAKYLQKE